MPARAMRLITCLITPSGKRSETCLLQSMLERLQGLGKHSGPPVAAEPLGHLGFLVLERVGAPGSDRALRSRTFLGGCFVRVGAPGLRRGPC